MYGRISAIDMRTRSRPAMSGPHADDVTEREGAMKLKAILLFALCSAVTGASVAWADVVRHPIPNSTFPIAQAVEVTGNARTVYVSGQVPPVVNKDADPNSPQAYGDTKTQTAGVLNRIKGIL